MLTNLPEGISAHTRKTGDQGQEETSGSNVYIVSIWSAVINFLSADVKIYQNT